MRAEALPISSRGRTVGAANCTTVFGRRGLIAVVVAFAVIALTTDANAQTRKQPARKAFSALNPAKIFESADSACTAAGAALSGPGYNYSRTDPVWCGGNIYGSLSQSVATSYSGAFANASGQVVCRWIEVRTSNFGGPPECGPPSSSSTTSNMDYPNMVQAVAVCPNGWGFDNQTTCSTPQLPVARPDSNCKKQAVAGNPVAIGTGCKLETVELYSLASGPIRIPIELAYANLYYTAGGKAVGDPSWFLDPIDRRIELSGTALAPARVTAARSHGLSEEFELQPGGTWKSFDNHVTLEQVSGVGWTRRDFREQIIERYDAQGRLASMRAFQGGGVDLVYAGPDPSKASQIISTSGQRVDLTYANGRVVSISLPGGATIGLAYFSPSGGPVSMSGSFLRTVTFEDQSVRTFNYVPGAIGFRGTTGYESGQLLNASGIPYDGNPNPGGNVLSPQFSLSGRSPYELSSIVDESGNAFSDYTYNDAGKVTLSRHAGNTYQFQFAYQAASTTVTEPLGGTKEYRFTPVAEQMTMNEIVEQGQGFYRSRTMQYDAQRRQVGEWEVAAGKGTCMEYDATTQRVAVRLEGRPWSAGCPGSLGTYVPPTGPGITERKTTYQWDPTWRLLTAVAQPNKVTVFAYHGLLVNGSAVNCAPGTAQVYGAVMPVLCWVEERATADVSGGLGLSAATVGTVRRTSFTYNDRGQVLTMDGSRTDLTDTRIYTYYTTAAADYSVGDLNTITNERGHVTTFTKFDRRGRPLNFTDANGTAIAVDYWPRGWLKSYSVTSGGVTRTTGFIYTPYGRLVRITEPSGAYIEFGYDAAQRVTSATDNLGNRVDYTLDGAGNIRDERYKTAAGPVARRVSRVFNDINRLQSITGALQ